MSALILDDEFQRTRQDFLCLAFGSLYVQDNAPANTIQEVQDSMHGHHAL